MNTCVHFQPPSFAGPVRTLPPDASLLVCPKALPVGSTDDVTGFLRPEGDKDSRPGPAVHFDRDRPGDNRVVFEGLAAPFENDTSSPCTLPAC